MHKLQEFTMPSIDGELQITRDKIGQEITGKLFRPHAFETALLLAWTRAFLPSQ